MKRRFLSNLRQQKILKVIVSYHQYSQLFLFMNRYELDWYFYNQYFCNKIKKYKKQLKLHSHEESS